MKKFFLIFALCIVSLNVVNVNSQEVGINDSEIDKILKAKEIVKQMVNYPDTLVFHNLYTKVSGNTVTLKFTCKNAFGVPETHIKDINVK